MQIYFFSNDYLLINSQKFQSYSRFFEQINFNKEMKLKTYFLINFFVIENWFEEIFTK